MKRVVGLFIVALAIALIPLSNIVYAQRPTPTGQEKTTICHYPGQKPEGRVMIVSGMARAQHLAMHGDDVWPFFAPMNGHPSGKFKVCVPTDVILICLGDTIMARETLLALELAEEPENCLPEQLIGWGEPCNCD